MLVFGGYKYFSLDHSSKYSNDCEWRAEVVACDGERIAYFTEHSLNGRWVRVGELRHSKVMYHITVSPNGKAYYDAFFTARANGKSRRLYFD